MARFAGHVDSSEGETPEHSPSRTPECTEKPVKRRASRAGTRSVSTLTPAQLSRKRANDREAQRAIRQRTKEHIEKLELRIAELESCGDHGPSTKFNEILMRNAVLERQIVQLARQLQCCAPVGYGAQKHYDHSDMSAVSQWQSNTFGPATDSVNNCEPMTSNGYMNASMTTGSFSPTSMHMPLTPTTNSQFIDTSVGSSMCSMGGTPNDIGSPTDWASLSSMDQSNSCQSIPRSVPSFPISPVSSNSPVYRQPPMYSWEIPTKLSPATSLVDGLLLNLIQSQRSMGMSNIPQSQLVGPVHPNLKSLIYDDPEIQNSAHPVSRAVFDVICNTLLEVKLPVRTAAFFLLHRLLQWHISPSPETYNNLPEWFQPRPSQNITSHAVWVDTVIFPKLREKIIDNQDLYANEEFHTTYANAINVNWPYRDLDVLEVVDEGAPGGGELRISEQFRRHLYNLGNWSLDPVFSSRYPELADVCRFTDVVKSEGGISGHGSPVGR